MRRKVISALAEKAPEHMMSGHDDIEQIKIAAMRYFEKELDAKIANAQWEIGEKIHVSFNVDIIRSDNSVRGGSGSQRNMPEYIEWRSAVYRRDEYTCQNCGTPGGKLNAHHVKAWQSNPELRFEVSNGVTLCFDCHAKEHPHIGFLNPKVVDEITNE